MTTYPVAPSLYGSTHALINLDPEQYSAHDDEGDIGRIENIVRELVRMKLSPEVPSTLVQATELASQCNYLCSPEVVAGLMRAFFKAHELGADYRQDSQAKRAANDHLARITPDDALGCPTSHAGAHPQTMWPVQIRTGLAWMGLDESRTAWLP